MNAVAYHSRKVAGLCIGTPTCKNALEAGSSKCRRCLDNQARAQRNIRRRRREEGLCARIGCKHMSESYLCASHQKTQTRMAFNYRHSSACLMGEANARLQAARNKRKDNGLCQQCTAKLWRSGFCENHWTKYHDARVEKQRALGVQRCEKKCSLCGTPGHRKNWCPFNMEASDVPTATAHLRCKCGLLLPCSHTDAKDVATAGMGTWVDM